MQNTNPNSMETVDIGQFQANCKPNHQYIKKNKNLEINQNQKIKINKKLYNDKKSNTKRFKYLMLDEDSKNSYQNYAIFNRENRIQPQMTAKLIERADTANGMTGICGEGSQRERGFVVNLRNKGRTQKQNAANAILSQGA